MLFGWCYQVYISSIPQLSSPRPILPIHISSIPELSILALMPFPPACAFVPFEMTICFGCGYAARLCDCTDEDREAVMTRRISPEVLREMEHAAQQRQRQRQQHQQQPQQLHHQQHAQQASEPEAPGSDSR